MTSCFVYKVMGLTFHDRINTQLIYRFELAQVVARRITNPPPPPPKKKKKKNLGSNLTVCFFLFSFFLFSGGGGGGWGLNSYSRIFPNRQKFVLLHVFY